MSISITYAAEGSLASQVPPAALSRTSGSVSPVAALTGVREVADSRAKSGKTLSQQVLERLKVGDVAGRSRSGDLQASSVGVHRSSDHVVTLHQTAKAATLTSDGFAERDTVRAGSLSLSIDGLDHNVAFSEGASLASVADSITALGLDVNASVTVDDGKQHLSITRKTVGYGAKFGSEGALSVSENYSGSKGQPLSLNTTQAAQNARLTVNGQTIERQTNAINDAVYGTTLRLTDDAVQAQIFDSSELVSASRPASRVSAFTVSVRQIAAAAEARSTDFASPYEQVQEGKVLIRVDGGQYLIPIAEGASLVQAASAINASGAPVEASLDRNDHGVALALKAKNTGFVVGSDPNTALQVSFEATGASGKALGLAVTQQAKNAKVVLNGQSIESRSNELKGTSGVPGISLRRTSEAVQTQGASSPSEPLTPSVDPDAHLSRLLQEQVLDLAVQTPDVTTAAATARKLYAPPPAEKDVAATATQATRGDRDNAEPKGNVSALLAEDPADKTQKSAPKEGLQWASKRASSAYGASVEKKLPYARPAEDKVASDDAWDFGAAVPSNRLLGSKAKDAYAQFAA